MKPVSLCWAMTVVFAIWITPGFGRFVRTGAISHPTMLAQDDGSVALPGSADSQGSDSGDDDGSGQVGMDGQKPDDDLSQPPAILRQPPDNDSTQQTPDGDSAQQSPYSDSAQQTPDDDSTQQESPDSDSAQQAPDGDDDDSSSQKRPGDNDDDSDTAAPSPRSDDN